MSEHDYMAQRAADKLRGLKAELEARLRRIEMKDALLHQEVIAEVLSGLDWLEDVARYVEGDWDALARLPVGRLS